MALFVVGVASMLVLPLPTALLDVLLVLNLGLALLLLLVGLYMPNALALLSFPSLLLLATLFRLGLNIASTRLILSQGFAGDVIQAFGTLLIQGQILVGVIIFLILTIIQFVVIARGASRISEVAARFALDSLPGKQMSIDADLRAGLITPQEAERRREKLRKESQLYGAMDGAMKFVQGDAIAGLFIIATNILGGLSIALSQGMGIQEALQTYTTLTIGDGLVSQIPAILIAVCAGIVVTRVATDEKSSLGSEVGAQLFQRPGVLALVGLMLSFLGLFPQLPTFPFLLLGAGCFLGAWSFRVSSDSGDRFSEKPRMGEKEKSLPSGEVTRLPGARLILELDSDSFYPLFQKHPQGFYQWWESFERSYRKSLGVRLPSLSVRGKKGLSIGGFRISLDGSELVQGRVPLDSVFISMHPRAAGFIGFEVVEEWTDPIHGGDACWIRKTVECSLVSESSGLQLFEAVQYPILLLAQYARKHPDRFLPMSDVHKQLKEIENSSPGFLAEALQEGFMNVARVTAIYHELIRQSVPVPDLRAVIEMIAGYSSTVGASLVEENEFDLQDIVGYARKRYRNELLTQQLGRPGERSSESLRLVHMHESVQDLLLTVPADELEGAFPIRQDRFKQLQKGLDALLAPVRTEGLMPVSILCPSTLRGALSSFLGAYPGSLPFLSEGEIAPDTERVCIGVWTVS